MQYNFLGVSQMVRRCRSPRCVKKGSRCVRPNAWQVYQAKQATLRASRGRKGLKSRSAARLYRKARRSSPRQLCRNYRSYVRGSRPRRQSRKRYSRKRYTSYTRPTPYIAPGIVPHVDNATLALAHARAGMFARQANLYNNGHARENASEALAHARAAMLARQSNVYNDGHARNNATEALAHARAAMLARQAQNAQPNLINLRNHTQLHDTPAWPQAGPWNTAQLQSVLPPHA